MFCTFCRGDHPRSRGVYYTSLNATVGAGGSSPLARGLRSASAVPLCECGIIPARAGFTSAATRVQRETTDHPRSRGVYWVRHPRVPRVLGSSPLARGLHAHHRQTPSQFRIIPARAGFTSSSTSATPSTKDHPRSRGVYPLPGLGYWAREGSSPLARGLQDGRGRRSVVGGIIPARAGFTARTTRESNSRSDHPRSRGVYLTKRAGVEPRLGSSPLARGLLFWAAHQMGSQRIIPARAGFTCWRTSPTHSPEDHPRSRGVYRGPARSQAPRALDHPRSRGVYRPRRCTWRCGRGSSPLARGLRRRPDRHPRRPGIIPARAGFT